MMMILLVGIAGQHQISRQLTPPRRDGLSSRRIGRDGIAWDVPAEGGGAWRPAARPESATGRSGHVTDTVLAFNVGSQGGGQGRERKGKEKRRWRGGQEKMNDHPGRVPSSGSGSGSGSSSRRRLGVKAARHI
ncbi:hypothetical protein B2J93_6649 [Marssonina coronariae]|uniref:Uncharacterized protein n=1 Tax=Diplocarpon coronariae TaxID=2795749 RepID=A0A218ZG75_9HELO|nr:hypothetical protein B2J93_6649 [Marssonina coronariae]